MSYQGLDVLLGFRQDIDTCGPRSISTRLPMRLSCLVASLYTPSICMRRRIHASLYTASNVIIHPFNQGSSVCQTSLYTPSIRAALCAPIKRKVKLAQRFYHNAHAMWWLGRSQDQNSFYTNSVWEVWTKLNSFHVNWTKQRSCQYQLPLLNRLDCGHQIEGVYNDACILLLMSLHARTAKGTARMHTKHHMHEDSTGTH
jgi:hypothetical protein